MKHSIPKHLLWCMRVYIDSFYFRDALTLGKWSQQEQKGTDHYRRATLWDCQIDLLAKGSLGTSLGISGDVFLILTIMYSWSQLHHFNVWKACCCISVRQERNFFLSVPPLWHPCLISFHLKSPLPGTSALKCRAWDFKLKIRFFFFFFFFFVSLATSNSYVNIYN